MRRIALIVGIICLAMSLFSAREAQAGWFGLNVGGACVSPNGALAATCPSVAAACESFAIFRNGSAPQSLGATPVYSQGRLEGYNCASVFFCCQLITEDLTLPECDVGQVPDPMAASGCSNIGAPNPAQFGECSRCNSGAGDMVGNPVNIAIGNKVEAVTDYRSQGSDTLAFTRYYNGLSTLTSSLGMGWRSTFDRQIIGLSGTLAPGQTLLLQRHDGAVYQFDPVSGGAYVSHELDIDGRLATDGATVWTFTDRDDTVETYDFHSGRLLSIRTRSGYQQSLQYDASGHLAGVTDSYGRRLSFTVANGVLRSMTDPDGRVYNYGYTAGLPLAGTTLAIPVNPDRLAQVTYPDNSAVQHVYEDTRFPYALTGIVDEDGNRFASWTYDNGRHPTSSQHAGGADAVTIANSITDLGGTVTVTNALGKQEVHAFGRSQSKVKLSGVNELAGAATPAASTSVTYDANGYVASRTDENGNVTLYQNDPRGLVLSKTEASGTPQQRVTTYTWLQNFHLPAQIVEPGRTTSFTYDAGGNLLSRTATDTTTATVPYSTSGRTRSFSYTYTAAGQVASATDPRGAVTGFAYDASGTLLTVTNALGQVTQVTSHDASGRPLTTVDANGVATTLTYDLRGRLSTATVGSATTTIAYDAAGNVTRITRPDGSFLAYGYDAAHRLVRVSDAFDERIDYTLDAMGNRTIEQISTAGGAAIAKTQSRVFDELGRLLQSIGAASQTTSYAYDNVGNLAQVTDPLSNVTGRSFDALNRLIQVAAPLSSMADYAYDAHDNRTSVTDPRGLVTSYVYDGLDNPIQATSPDTGTTVYVVDDAGNRVQATDAAGHVVQMSYDALNRITAKTYPNDPTENITYTYDEAAAGFGIGRLTSVIDEAGTTAYVYDAHGNVVQETRVIDLTTYVTAYAYDLADHVVQVTYPSGRIVSYTRDAMGRIADVATQANGAAVPVAVASGAAYAPFGPLTSLSYGNGLGLSVSYDRDYQPSARLVAGAATVQDLSYGVDADGDITGITDLLVSTRSQNFQYDALQRLTFASGLYGALAYGYDAVGNRTSQSGGTTNLAETYTYAANSNQLLSVANGGTTRSLAYSATGALASDSRSGTGLNFEYGEDDRPDQVASPVQVLAMYDHDFLGRRVMKDVTGTSKKQHKINKHPKKKTPPSVITHFLYDRSGHLLAEPDAGTGATGNEYLWLDDMPVALVSAGTLYFVHPDHLGTPQKITDAAQAIAFDLVLRPFGQAEQQTFPSLTNLRFPGQYFDAEDSLHQNWFRDFDPSIGRYVESDPIGLKGGINTYGYARNNPIKFTDPTGQRAFTPCWLVNKITLRTCPPSTQCDYDCWDGSTYETHVVGFHCPFLDFKYY